MIVALCMGRGRVLRPLPMLLRSATYRAAATLLLAIPVASGSAQTSIAVSGDPPPLVVSAAVAGSEPTVVTASWSTYAVTATAGQKITVSLDEPPPPGMSLEIALAAPEGATSAGSVILSTVPQDAVVSLPAGAHSGLLISYAVRATVAAGVVSVSGMVVTFTLSDGL